MKSAALAFLLKTEFIIYAPLIRADSTDDGEECTELVIPAKKEGELDISVNILSGEPSLCTLWLGGICIGDKIEEKDIVTAISTLLSDGITAVEGFRNEKRFEKKEPYFYRAFLPDESDELETLLIRLHRSCNLAEKLFSVMRGVFVISKRSGREIINR